MVGKTLATFTLILVCAALRAAGQNRPEFCEQLPKELLGGLQAPYEKQVAPDGAEYCEGLLRNPIALEAPTVVSVKQTQTQYIFNSNQIASLTWCDDFDKKLHVKVRSTKPPLFALDAMHALKFEWRTELIARWQPNWKDLASLGIRTVEVDGHTYQVVVPLRIGTGYSNLYSFIIRSKQPIHLSKVLIEPIQPPNKPLVVNISLSSGPAKDTWTTTIPFGRMPSGIYRLTFQESVEQAGNATKPIYLLHRSCNAR